MELKKKINPQIIIAVVITIIVIVGIIGVVFTINRRTTEEQKIEESNVEKLNKEEMLQQAKVLDLNVLESISYEYNKNKARAIDLYNGKIFKYTSKVLRIEKDYCYIGYEIFENDTYTVKCVGVYLSNSELLTLDKGDTITVVGKLNVTDIMTMSPAYLVNE